MQGDFCPNSNRHTALTNMTYKPRPTFTSAFVDSFLVSRHQFPDAQPLPPDYTYHTHQYVALSL